MNEHWFVYLLRCGDGTLYTGATNDPLRRLKAHNTGRGAKYTRSRRPCDLVYCAALASKHDALSREAAIKKLRRSEKEKLCTSAENLAEKLLSMPSSADET